MCEFLSAVVTPHGIFWCEDWSPCTVRERLSIDEDYVEVKYDTERGMEVRYPFGFVPEWFDQDTMFGRIKELYETLKPIYDKLNQKAQEFYDELVQQNDELHDSFSEQKTIINADCEERLEALDRNFNERMSVLHSELNEQVDAVNEEFNHRCTGIEGYVPKRRGEEMEEDVENIL